MKVAILHFAGPPTIGGVESVMGHHARLMAEQGHEVCIIAGRGEECIPGVRFKQVPLIDSRNSTIGEIKAQLDKGVVPNEFSLVQAEIKQKLTEIVQDFDVLFVHNVFTMAKNLCLTSALREIAEEDGPRVVAWHHDLAAKSDRYQDELHPGWPWSLMSSEWDTLDVFHVAVSEMRKSELLEVMDIPSSKVKVAPSGVDRTRLLKLSEEGAAIFSKLDIAKHYPLILLPVRITRRKNIEMALRIVAEMQKSFPDAALIVTGPPGAHNAENVTYFDELKSLRKELQLEPSSKASGAAVYFLAESHQGFLPDEVIADHYQIADLLLMPSTEEGFGIPIIEAALSRVPVFCSELPPFKEIAGDMLNYFSLDDSPASIAERMTSFLNKDTTFALRRKIEREFSWDSVYAHHIKPFLENS